MARAYHLIFQAEKDPVRKHSCARKCYHRQLIVLPLIEVGPPVTRRPPHGSRRAVFPHRALQGCSLPHEQSAARFAIPRSEVCMRSPACRVRLMLPLRATQPCRSLPQVVGSPASEYYGAI